ncbi:flippase [Halobaculum limi]|uniref:flippase n=1 Tax=Halobaculum limi TaxID=3031916 RepID=UPI0024076A4E|nr:flippase [Halobaculum sp. YSMS11]
MVDDSELKGLLSSTILVFLGSIVASVSGLVERIIIGRFLGPSDYGIISVGITIFTLLSIISIFGLNQGIPRYISRYEETRKKRGVWVSAIAICISISILLVILANFFIQDLSRAFLQSSEYGRVLSVFVVAIPFYSGFRISIAAIRGYEITKYKTYTQDLIYPLGRIAILLALLTLGYELVAAGFAYFASSLLVFVVSLYYANNVFSLFGPAERTTSKLLQFSFPLIVSSIIGILLTRTDTLMVGYFNTPADVGQYSAAYPVAAGLQLVLSSFGFLYLPLASKLDAKGRTNELNQVYQMTTRWIFIISLPALVTFVVIPQKTMVLLWGVEYQPAGVALSILALGFFTNVMVGRNRETLSALGETRHISYANLLAFSVNVLLNIILVPRYSYVGAAVSSLISFTILNIYVFTILFKNFRITPFSKANAKTYAVLIAFVFPIGNLLSLTTESPLFSFLAVLFGSATFTVVLTLVAGLLQPEDKLIIEMIESKIPLSLKTVKDQITE